MTASISLPLNFTGCPPTNSKTCDEAIYSLRLLAAEISLGLMFLHDRGIVHQDIKPANIMISSTGHAVIGDFGAAKELPLCGNTPERAAKYGSIVLQHEDLITFTPLYAAPELRERTVEGLVVYNECADWWSLGILLYELVTGSVPFNIPGGIDTLRKGRRSDGDPSLTFGELESLPRTTAKGGYDWYPHLDRFLRSVRLSFSFNNPMLICNIGNGCSCLSIIQMIVWLGYKSRITLSSPLSANSGQISRL